MKKKSYTNELEVETALQILLNAVAVSSNYEEVSIYDSALKITAKNYTTVLQNPPFDRSPLDGYALNSDYFLPNTSKTNPTKLKVTMHIYAGNNTYKTLENGCAARIMTGGMIPKGANCVVRQEDTDYGEEYVHIYKSVKKNTNICYAGEDVNLGTSIVNCGERLTAPVISILAGQGYGKVLMVIGQIRLKQKSGGKSGDFEW